MNPVQQTLFDNDLPPTMEEEHQIPIEEPRLKEWSYSRREVFEKCQRLYYYQYYGASARTAKQAAQKDRIRFLRGLRSRHLRAGDLMHLAIRCSLKARAEKGREWSQSFLVQFARERFRADVNFSRGYKEGAAVPTELAAPKLLMEFYHGMSRAEQWCEEVEAKMVRALECYQTSPQYTSFRSGVDGGQAEIESKVSVKHLGVSLKGKVDLAFLKSGRATVVDWKMGAQDGGADSLQLMFYAIWAMDTFTCGPEQVDLIKAYLGDGTVSRFDFEPKSILRAKARISQDVERMRAVDAYGRDGIAEAFTPCGQPRVCATCNFQSICPKE